jgi:hypothetical protein
MGWQGKWQHYYLVEAVGGTFGTGRGEEMIMSGPEKGSYLPVWMAIDDLLKQPVLPHEMAELVVRHRWRSWPAQPIIIPEQK